MRVRATEPGFEATLPEGFASQTTPQGPRQVVGAWVRGRGPGDVTMVAFVRLPGVYAQGHEREVLEQLRDTFDMVHFEDRHEGFDALGFHVEGLRGVAERDGEQLVRFAVPVPTADTGLVLLVTAEAPHEAEARALARSILGSLRATPSWRTQGQKRWDRVAASSLTFAVLVTLLYGALAGTLFRRLDRWRKARGAALLSAGLAWALMASWVFLELRGFGASALGTGALMLACGVAFVARGVQLARARAELSA